MQLNFYSCNECINLSQEPSFMQITKYINQFQSICFGKHAPKVQVWPAQILDVICCDLLLKHPCGVYKIIRCENTNLMTLSVPSNTGNSGIVFHYVYINCYTYHLLPKPF